MKTLNCCAISISSLFVISCTSTMPCEDILEVNRQIAQCESLSRTMSDNRYPQQALTARKRYESECENFRYYRDEYDTICKSNQKGIGAQDLTQDR